MCELKRSGGYWGATTAILKRATVRQDSATTLTQVDGQGPNLHQNNGSAGGKSLRHKHSTESVRGPAEPESYADRWSPASHANVLGMTEVESRRIEEIKFEEFSRDFLDPSFRWLTDEEIKKLTMTPCLTRAAQLRWFESLSARSEYLIWGIRLSGTPVGAVGLKNITDREGEYWGYLGERESWGRGIGSAMIDFIFSVAKERDLTRIYLSVSHDNCRAVRLYVRKGFSFVSRGNGAYIMERKL